ncbi:uncharacterized protein BT62DRAFT_621861 [Guyanagaster necrorhizus]|uniref:Uncharacterized protein n=1 Tax=Guyanagaster necrorhizus TaxID=856835 RepID=A0A9P8AVY6_9AGAR|nr:uncharacterized protein BT62DRAFT_621861 [Guyanagaster necrorhizus MCA 3950]KAG7450064.1 hypothetical protein BT62DRAFT_621861 [Guyanagaster necrorhizus MCA 3950]
MLTSVIHKRVRPHRFRHGVKKTTSDKSNTSIESPSLRPQPTTLVPQNAESWPPQMVKTTQTPYSVTNPFTDLVFRD